MKPFLTLRKERVDILLDVSEIEETEDEEKKCCSMDVRNMETFYNHMSGVPEGLRCIVCGYRRYF